MSRAKYVRFLFAGVLIVLAMLDEVRAGGLRIVAVLGQAAAGTGPGAKFNSFSPPVINNRGETAFDATLFGTGVTGSNMSGVWSEGGGNGLQLIARQGSAVPSFVAGDNFGLPGTWEGPVINDAGATAFTATVFGPGIDSTNSVGIWSNASGSVAAEVRTGDPAPGTTAKFTSFGNSFSSGAVGLIFNNSGKIAFQAQTTTSGTGFTGIWSGGGGNPLSLVAASQGPAPGTTFKFGNLDGQNGPIMNNLGQVAFTATAQNGDGVWSERGGNGLQLVAHAGDHAPGTPAGVTFNGFYYHPGQNDAGNVGFYGSVTGPGVTSSNDEGIWSDSGGTLHLVVREGDPIVGSRIGFAGAFSERVMNARGEMAFTSSGGIWSEGGGHGLRAVALGGQPIPGAAGIKFQPLDVANAPVINSLGECAFMATIIGSGINDGTGVFAEDISGQLHTIVRTGDVIDISTTPGVPLLKTISSVQFVGQSGNDDGRRSGFNDFGQVVFEAIFTDRSSGVFVSDLVVVPEPSTAVLAIVAMAMLSGRQRLA